MRSFDVEPMLVPDLEGPVREHPIAVSGIWAVLHPKFPILSRRGLLSQLVAWTWFPAALSLF
jgi:hypothetical protein